MGPEERAQAVATGVSGAVSLNDVHGGATSTLSHATVKASGGNVLVQAKETAALTASTTSEVSATQSSTGTGGTGGTSLAVGGLIGTNLVLSAATATLSTSQVTTTGTGTGAGGVTVDAENTATLTATTVNAATATTTTTGTGGTGGTGGSGNTAPGVTLAFNTIGYKAQNVLFNTIDALIGDPAIANAFGLENPSNATATMLDTTVTASGVLTVSALDSASITSSVKNTSTASTSGSGTGMKGGQNLALGIVVAMNKVSSAAVASIDFDTGNLPASTIQAGAGVSVTAQDSPAIGSTITLGASSSTSSSGTGGTGTGGSSGATGVSGAVSLNDVHGGAKSTLSHATVTASGGNVLVQAKEMAILTASTTSEVSATQSSTGTGGTGGTSLAVGGLIGTNLVHSAATATLSNSQVTTTATGTGAGGVTVDAENSATLTATTVNAATATTTTSGTGGTGGTGGSGNTAPGVTLAFNTIGYEAQNVLFNTIDALIGDPAIANAFGLENPSNATASMLDTTVTASGLVTVSAVDSASITSSVTNTSMASTSGSGTGVKGGQNLALGIVVAMNKVSSAAQASIDYSSSFSHATTPDISGGGGVSVTAQDSPIIGSTITLGASSSTSSSGTGGTGTGGSSGATGVSGAVSLNDVHGGATSTLSHATVKASGGNVLVQAKEMAALTASTTSEVSATQSSTGTGGAGGTSLAVGGLIGTNLVLSAATATLSTSQVTTTGTGTGAGGVTVDAENTATLTATTVNAATATTTTTGTGGTGGTGGSGNTAPGVTLAFNTIGYKAQNVLFNTIDALIGDPAIANAFGLENPSNATATMLDTMVTASGVLTVSALDSAVDHIVGQEHEHGVDQRQRDRYEGGPEPGAGDRGGDEQGEQRRCRQHRLRHRQPPGLHHPGGGRGVGDGAGFAHHRFDDHAGGLVVDQQ